MLPLSICFEKTLGVLIETFRRRAKNFAQETMWILSKTGWTALKILQTNCDFLKTKLWRHIVVASYTLAAFCAKCVIFRKQLLQAIEFVCFSIVGENRKKITFQIHRGVTSYLLSYVLYSRSMQRKDKFSVNRVMLVTGNIAWKKFSCKILK